MANKYLDETGVTYLWNKIKNEDYKSLYNLGAYDTISGNVITRQTGYVDLGSLEWSYDTSKAYFYVKYPNIIEPSAYNIEFYGVTSKYTTTSWSDMNSGQDKSICYVVGYIRIKDTSYTDVASLKVNLQGVILQYKLKKPYTEKIIEGQPLITLDQQGSQWLRSEWGKGLNLWDEQWEVGDFNWNTGEPTYNNSRIRSKSFSRIKPSTSYFISAPNGIDILFYDSSKNYINNIYRNNAKFETPNNAYYLKICNTATNVYNNDIMLNEGDHPYPYQAYDYSGHIENEQGRYLIEKEEEARNLFSKEGIDPNCYYNYSNGVRVAKNDFSESDFISVQVNTQYYILSSESGYHVCFYDSNKTFISGTLSNPFITPSNASYLRFAFRNTAINATMLLKGSKPLPYQPYNSKAHITNYEADFLKDESLKSANLLENTNSQNYGLNFLDNNTTYTLSFSLSANIGVTISDGNSNIVDRTLSSGYNSFTFIKKTGGNAFIWFADVSKVSNIMLNEGSVALPYQPYEGKVVHEKGLGEYVTTDTNQIISGLKTFKGNEHNDISFVYNNDGAITNFYHVNTAIRHALQFPWYNDIFQIGNVRGGGTDSFGFGVTKGNNQLIALFQDTSTAYIGTNLIVHSGNIASQFKTINGNSIVGSGDLSFIADSVFTEVTDVVDTFIINRNGTWLITCLGYNKIYASDNSSISFYGSALVSMTSAGSDPHICINGTAYACSSAITFVTSGIMQVYKKAN